MTLRKEKPNMKMMVGWDPVKYRKARVIRNVPFWGLSCERGYLEFPLRDGSAISVAPWADNISVNMHKHAYYEVVLLTKGSCVHRYRGVEVPLIQGDLFMIPPHEEHGYIVRGQVEFINCNFIAEDLGEESNHIIQTAEHVHQHFIDKTVQERWDQLINEATFKDPEREFSYDVQQSYLEQQGILHLSSEKQQEVEDIFWKMIEEQENNLPGAAEAKAAWLQLVLVYFQRIEQERREDYQKFRTNKKELIYQAISYMEAHLSEPIDFEKLAKNCYMSMNYFRSVFKAVTGLRPVEYMNRMRIIKSLEYLQRDNCSVTDAALRVGFSNSNYFARTFKQVMGYSPRHFRNISK